jgi:hypothetical protein
MLKGYLLVRGRKSQGRAVWRRPNGKKKRDSISVERGTQFRWKDCRVGLCFVGLSRSATPKPLTVNTDITKKKNTVSKMHTTCNI